MARRDFLKHLGFHSQTTLCMSKRLFQILDEMNQNDDKNRTATCACCFDLVGAKTANGGGHVTMGVPADAVHKIFIGDYQPFLILLNKKEYDRIEKASPAVAPNTQLPAEWLEEIERKSLEWNQHGHRAVNAYKIGAREYATKLCQAENEIEGKAYEIERLRRIVSKHKSGRTNQEQREEIESLKRWKEEAKQLLNPVWEFADKNLKVPLGQSKTDAVLMHLNDARALLHEVLVMNEMWGDLPGEYINKIKQYLDGSK